jgi:hypothetical protein
MRKGGSMTKKEAVEQLIKFCEDHHIVSLSLQEAEAVLDFATMEDGENGIGLLPPLSKKGRYIWEAE